MQTTWWHLVVGNSCAAGSHYLVSWNQLTAEATFGPFVVYVVVLSTGIIMSSETTERIIMAWAIINKNFKSKR